MNKPILLVLALDTDDFLLFKYSGKRFGMRAFFPWQIDSQVLWESPRYERASYFVLTEKARASSVFDQTVEALKERGIKEHSILE